jgi:molecular chaperone DnaK
MVQDAEQHAEDDKHRKELVEARNQADSLVYSTEKNLKEYGDKISDEEKAAIETAIAEVREVLDGDDAGAINTKSEALMQASMKLGEAMYKSEQESASGPSADAGAGAETGTGSPRAAEDSTVVDADFEEVDPDKKDN